MELKYTNQAVQIKLWMKHYLASEICKVKNNTCPDFMRNIFHFEKKLKLQLKQWYPSCVKKHENNIVWETASNLRAKKWLLLPNSSRLTWKSSQNFTVNVEDLFCKFKSVPFTKSNYSWFLFFSLTDFLSLVFFLSQVSFSGYCHSSVLISLLVYIVLVEQENCRHGFVFLEKTFLKKDCQTFFF